MIYLFSYQDKAFVLCSEETLGNEEVVKLTKLDDSKAPTNQIKYLEKSTKDIFLNLCESFITNNILSYTKINSAPATISKAIKAINEAFTALA